MRCHNLYLECYRKHTFKVASQPIGNQLVLFRRRHDTLSVARVLAFAILEEGVVAVSVEERRQSHRALAHDEGRRSPACRRRAPPFTTL